MAKERQANCKECGEVYSYSLEWAEALAAQGRSPMEYCPRCRAIHALERRSVAMPYFTAKPIGPRRPDQELSPGRLGRLTHFDRSHRTVSIPAKFHLPDSDIEFGIKDEDILELIEIVQQHQVTVVVGPTGSGKSTFVPYRLMVPPAPYPPDLFTRYGQIIVTQPRIQATRNIPAFVARDLHGCTLGAGGDVGYVHRGERAADRHAKLVYCTDGTLINWIASGRIADFSVIMIDEAHERSLNIDVILGLLKVCLPLYPHLKLIIASATIDANLFIRHFSSIGEVGFKDFEGLKRYDYQRCYSPKRITGKEPRLEKMVPALTNEVVRLLHEIASGQRESCTEADNEAAPEGDILAFLSTVSSIEKAVASIRAKIQDDPVLSGREIQVYSLHRRLPLEVQDLALQKKSKAIAGKVLQALQEIAEGKAADGDILALVLDKKSAEETVAKITEGVAATPALAGTAIGLSLAEAAAPDWNEPPQRTVVVTTHDEAARMDLAAFRRVICDRRVVISTNVAETSLTVDGIVYVVDSGLIVKKQWDMETLTESYPTGWHSQDGCKQRWGRSGRVRDGYAHCLYTQAQYDEFEAHTLPEIQRAPLEAVVLTAKRAGVDDVVDFPWIQPPDPRELERAVQTLQDRGLLDEDGDLTEHGQVVGWFGTEPNVGHLLVLADQFACAVEAATLIPMMRNLKLRGGLLRWHDQWDGHTRRAVRQIHEGLLAGCRDDVAVLLKVYQAWSEAWRPELNWLTGEPFRQIWPGKVPAPTAEMTQAFGETAMAELVEAAKHGQGEGDLRRLVDDLLPNPLAEGWLNQAMAAMRDARRAAWARRFFVNHAVLVKLEAARQEILERLSIGKKEIEARPLDFDRLLDRVRLVMAYAWSDRVYQKQNGRYQAVSPRSRELEKDFLIEISHDSILSGRTDLPDAFVCGTRAAGKRYVRGKRSLYIGLLAVLDPAWLPALQLPPLELAQWVARHLRRDGDDGLAGEGFHAFLDQHYPLRSRYACRAIGSIDGGEIPVAVGELLLPPPLIEETTPEGEIVWAGEIAEGVENDLDEQAGVDPDVKAMLDPEAEDPLDGLEVDESAVVGDVVVQLVHAAPGVGPVSVFLDGVRAAQGLLPMGNTGYRVLPEGRYRLAIVGENTEGEASVPMVEQDMWLDSGRPWTVLLAMALDGDARVRLVPGSPSDQDRQTAMVRLIHAAAGIHGLRLVVGVQRTETAVPFLERTAFLSVLAGEARLVVEGEDGAVLAETELKLGPGQAYNLVVARAQTGALVARVWPDAPSEPLSALQPVVERISGLAAGAPALDVVGVMPAGGPSDTVQMIPGEVVGYEVGGLAQPRLRVCHSSEPGAFEQFHDRHQVGDQVEVMAAEIEQGPESNQVALVVEVPDCGLEVVMEPTDLSFASRYEPLKMIRPGTRFQAVVEEVVRRTGRVYLSCLPLLEEHLPRPGIMVEGIVSETGQGGVHISLPPPPPGLPLPLSAYAVSEDVPQSIMQHGQGDRVTMQVDFEPYREKKLVTITPALQELLKEARWKDRVGWDAAGHKLWVRGRLTNDERLELRAHADNPRCRRALTELYRLSNQMRARVSMADILATYARHIEPGAIVPATVVKVWNHEVLLSLADGVRAKLALGALKDALRRRVDRGDKVEVVVKSVEPQKDFVDVRLPSRAERLLQRYPPGSVHKGRVARIENYGALVELEPSVRGLVQAEELSWCKVVQVADVVQVDDEVMVRVLRVRSDGKMDLSRRVEDNDPKRKYPADSQAQGKVIKLLPFGALVQLEPGVVGMIHISELAWKRVNLPNQVVGLGQKLTVRVLKVHGDPRKLDLSLKTAFRACLRIPQSRIGTLIGRKGRTIKGIKAETDTEIRVSSEGVITVWGDGQSKVDAAQARIRALIPEAEAIIEDG